MTHEMIAEPVHDDRRARRALAILVWAQSTLGAQMPLHFVLGGLVGQMLASDPKLATLPISMTVMGSMCTAPVMSQIMARWGRRTGFLIGAFAAICAALLAMEAISAKSFEAFCAASFMMGIYMSAHGFYRFAAADCASPAFRPKAISWVMAGGLVAAILGPQMVKQFADWMEPIPYAGAYKAMIFLNLVAVIPVMFLDIPKPPKGPEGARTGRPWREILADRRVVVAMFCAMVSYALMNLVMTSTPLAMLACGFAVDDAAEVVSIHVFLMFAPSFFSGHLIARYGAPRIIAVGLVTLALCCAVAVSGITFIHFSIALGLLGIGWNFGFIGATAMLAGAHRPEERAKVQGLNDFLVFGLVTVASFGSGALMAEIGWEAVNYAMLPALGVAALALAWLSLAQRTAEAT
ncbi:MAG: MFS transporter [Pseudomonadota bacterium]